MSRALASGYLLNTNAIISALPVSVFCWAKVTTPTSYQTFWSCQKHDLASAYTQLRLGVANTGGVFMSTYNSSGGQAEVTTTGSLVAADTWTPVCAVWAGDTERRIYAGTYSETFTNSLTFTGTPTRTIFGAMHYLTTSFTQRLTGSLAHVAVWSTALTAGEADWLCRGGHPLLVQRTSMVGYAPLTTNTDPEPDWVWGQDYSLTNATYSTSDPSIGRALPTPRANVRQATIRAAMI